MKEVKVKSEVINTRYEACDGTRFPSEESCANYEKSVLTTLLCKLKSCEINRGTEYELFNAGSDEYEIRLYNIQTNSDLDNINTLYHYCRPDKDDNLIESVGEFVMINKFKYITSADEVSFAKVSDFINNLLGNKFKVTFYPKEHKIPVSDVSELEYADEI